MPRDFRKETRAGVRIIVLLFFVTIRAFAAHAQTPAKSWVTTGAQVADGTGSPLRVMNVRVEGDRIVKVGNFSPRKNETVIRADGLVLAPGFIDIHNHSTQGLEKEPLAETQVSQGITTLLLGQDGGSPWPIGEFLAKMRQNPAALNFLMLVGHATVREKEYLQDPASIEALGAPLRITRQQRSGTPLSRTTYGWSRHAYGSGYEVRSFGYPSSITEERFELDGVRVSSTVTANVFDSYGALVQRQVTTTEHAKGLNPYAQHIETVAQAGVVNDTSSWCLGRPATTLITRQHSLPGGSAVTRTVAHGWDFVRCRSTQQVVEPSSTSLRVATDLAYDSYGNVSSETVTPVGLPARTTSLAWGENGRFLTTRTNAEGHVERLAWDSATGLPVTSTDPNGLVTSLQHDDLGRVVRQTRPDGTSTVISRTSCGTNCVWPGAAYLVSVMQRGVGEVPIVSAETGYDRAGREVYRRSELPGGSQNLQVLRYDARGRLAHESVPLNASQHRLRRPT